MLDANASDKIPILTKKTGVTDKSLQPIVKMINKSGMAIVQSSKVIAKLSKIIEDDKKQEQEMLKVLEANAKANSDQAKISKNQQVELERLSKMVKLAESGKQLSRKEVAAITAALSSDPKYQELVEKVSGPQKKKIEKRRAKLEKRGGKEKDPGFILTKFLPQLGRAALGPLNLIAETFTQYAWGKDVDELLSEKIVKGIEKRREKRNKDEDLILGSSGGGGPVAPDSNAPAGSPLGLPMPEKERAPMNPTKSQVSRAGEIGALYIVQELSKSLGVTTPAQKKAQGRAVKEKFVTKQIKAGPFVTKAYSAGRGLGAFFEGLFEGLGAGLNKLAKGKALKGAFVLGIIGASIVAIGWAISSFVRNVDIASVAVVSLALLGLSFAVTMMGKEKGILKGALVLAIIGAILVGVAWGLSQFTSSIDPVAVVAIAGAMVVLGGAMNFLGRMPINVMLMGALGLILVAAALGIGFGIIGGIMSLLPEGVEEKMTSFAGALLAFANPQLLLLLAIGPALLAFGLALIVMTPGILIAGGAFALVGDSLMKNLAKFTELDGDKLSGAAKGILELSGALLVFGAGQLGSAIANVGASILNFFAGDPINKLQQFADMSDPLQKTAQAMLDISSSIEKFANRDIMDSAATNLLNVGNAAAGIYPKVMQGNVVGTQSGKQGAPNASVNDAIIKSDGTIIETSPDDNLIATKSPIQSIAMATGGKSESMSVDLSGAVDTSKMESLLQELLTFMKGKKETSDKPYNVPSSPSFGFAFEGRERLL
jgi:hypothetical protein